MAITFELPGLEDALRDGYGDLDAAAKEALLVDAYRRGRLTRPALGRALDLGRLETLDLLAARGVPLDLPTPGDEALIADYRAGRISTGRLAELLGLTTVMVYQWMADRDVYFNYSVEDWEQDLAWATARATKPAAPTQPRAAAVGAER